MQIPPNMSAALDICCLFYVGSPSQSSSIRRKTRHAPDTATLEHDSSIRFSPNRANGVAVFEGSPIRYNKARPFRSDPVTVLSRW